MVIIEPRNSIVWCRYTLIEPVSHHDPGQADKSNFSLYRRQLRRIELADAGDNITQEKIDQITKSNPVPIEIAAYFEDEPFSRFIAICITRLFIQEYGQGNGHGLFSGMERYRRLEDRLSQTASRTNTLKSFWSVFTKEMKVPPLRGENIHFLMDLLVQPRACISGVLYQFAKYSQLIQMLARTWVEAIKLANPKMAELASKTQTSAEMRILAFTPESTGAPGEISVALPVHSGNDIRHDLREASMYHMLHMFDIDFDESLPLEIRTLLENGGAMSEGSPQDTFRRQQIIRENYPIWGLLGGSMKGYLLGEGNLQSVSCYFKGRENNEALADISVVSNESVVDLLDLWTLTRHSTRTESNPLPFEFEVIQPGAELYVRFQFHPFTRDLERGAFISAMQTFEDTESSIGGGAARGFGRVKVEYLKHPEDLFEKRALYEAYLTENYGKLRDGLVDGTLGINRQS